jgi:hypothetical protein
VEGIPGSLEQQIIHEPRVVQAQTVQLMGQSKNDMEIGRWQELILLLNGPHLLIEALTLWTMAVTARIVADA